MSRRHPNLVGWWMMDGNLSDWSGAGNNGTVGAGSAAYAAGRFGRAKGPNWGITAPVSVTNDAFTISCWVKFFDFLGGSQTLVGTNVVTGHPFFHKSGSQNEVYLVIGELVTQDAQMTLTNNLSNDVWYHLCVTYSNPLWFGYVDGEQVSEKNRNRNINMQQVGIGWNGPPSTFGEFILNGLLDDIRIYNAALSPSDIQRVMRGQQPARVYS